MSIFPPNAIATTKMKRSHERGKISRGQKGLLKPPPEEGSFAGGRGQKGKQGE